MDNKKLEQTTGIQKRNLNEFERQALEWPKRAAQMDITDQESYDLVVKATFQIVAARKSITSLHADAIRAADEAHKKALALRNTFLVPLKEAEQIVKDKIAAWEDEQENLRRQEQKRLAEEQRKKDEEARLDLAVEAEQNGATQKTVESILQKTASAAVAPVAGLIHQRTKGISTQKRWRAEVYDLRALCQAIGEGTQPTELVLANMTALNSLARALKGAMNVPGVRAVSKGSVTAK
jgi:hypothetical protein